MKENDTFKEIQANDNRQPAADKLWLSGCFIVTIIAAFLRFWQLTLKPMHHDEGVNGYFLTTLFREGVYKYDPSNYHGPDLYYLALAFAKIFGLNTMSVRASVAVFGVLTVVLSFFLYRRIGRIGALSAGLFLALSPGMTYISRYFIHEILFVFFSLAIVVGVLRFFERRKAGAVSVAVMTLLLLVCFLPTVINLSSFAAGDSIALLWALRVSLFAVEAVLVFMIMRMLFRWNEGRPVYLILASASAVMLFATKETAFITIGTMLIACVCVAVWQKILSIEGFAENKVRFAALAQVIIIIGFLPLIFIYRQKFSDLLKWLYEAFAGAIYQDALFYSLVFLSAITAVSWILFFRNFRQNGEEEDFYPEPVALTWRNFRERIGNSSDLILMIAACAFVFVYLGVLFFSSFFTYPYGVAGAFEAYMIWTKTGTADHTQNGYLAYLKWGYQLEAAIFLLSALGLLIAFIKGRNRFAMFAGLWALGLFLAYTIIPYKTPWLALSFILPMCVAGGYAINEIAAMRAFQYKILAAALALTASGTLAYQTYDLNFLRYDDDRMAYVYAHTKRGFLDLIDKIEYYAGKSGEGKKATIEIVSPDYWSMPWYLNDYPNARFGGQFADANAQELIVAGEKQKEELNDRYGAHYKYAGTYPLRPGVDLILLVRKDLADPDARELYTISEE